MSSPSSKRRPSRRTLPFGVLREPPLALREFVPTINGPNTVFEGGVNQQNARIASSAATPEVARITCSGWWNGGFNPAREALEIGNEGESIDGTQMQITFDAVLDLTQPWQISIPSDTPLIQSRFGGRLAGTFAAGQPLALADGGFVRLSNLTAGTLGPHQFVWTGITKGPANNEITFSVDAATLQPFQATGSPDMRTESGATAGSFNDLGGGSVRITFSVDVDLDSLLCWNPGSGTVGKNGATLAGGYAAI
jgi:hypothetical protein